MDKWTLIFSIVCSLALGFFIFSFVGEPHERLEGVWTVGEATKTYGAILTLCWASWGLGYMAHALKD